MRIISHNQDIGKQAGKDGSTADDGIPRERRRAEIANHVDAATLKQAANGRWAEILTALGGIASEVLDGKHHPCPKCGGTDRFRFSDMGGDGSIICNQCGRDIGDGIGALRWATGQDFRAVAQMLTEYMRCHTMTKGRAATKSTAKPPTVYATAAEALDVYTSRHGAPSLRWEYHDADGVCVRITYRWDRETVDVDGQVTRAKEFRPIARHGEGWICGDLSEPRPLYRLATLESATRVYVSEGEKAVDATVDLGLIGTTSPNGSGSARKADWTPLSGKEVIILPDHDAPGKKYAGAVVEMLSRLDRRPVVKIVRLPDLPEGGDAYEYIERRKAEGATRNEIRAEIEALADAIEIATLGEVFRVADDIAVGASGDVASVPALSTAQGRTEAANAKRFWARYGTDVRYCDPWGKWLKWDTMRWRIDDTRTIDVLGKETCRRLWAERDDMAAKYDRDSKDGKEVLRAMTGWCQCSAAERSLRAMLSLARSEPGIPVVPSQLDQDPWLLNVTNGTIDLRTGTLREHDRRDNITKLSAVAFDAMADCKLWVEFLRVVLPDPDLRAFVRRLVGYSLTGSTREHILPFLYGTGANGKSVFLNTIAALLGTDYAIKAPADLLLAKRNESHPTELADLFRKRFVACIEAEDGKRLAESLVKELTGGDKIRARRMREDFWEFSATHKLWLAANHKPQVRGTDHGIWRRIKLIPFTVTIPDDRQDKTLPDKLLGELPGILNWALHGCLEWQRDGLGEPPAVTTATAAYRNEMDVLGDFLQQQCVLGDSRESGAGELYAAYKSWAESSGERHVTQKRFAQQLTERGYQSGRYTSGPKKGRNLWRGVGLSAGDASEG